MKKLIIGGLLLLCGATNVFALNFGTDITINDKNVTSNYWHESAEDQEVEPGMAHGQIWDLEGFFLQGNQLSIVGGYDFVNGQNNFTSGDLFLDIDNDALFGDIHGTSNGNKNVLNTFGYDYVVDLNFTTNSYDVYAIDANSIVVTSYYNQNQGSNPWQFNAEDNDEVILSSGSFVNHAGLSDGDTGFNGGTHYAIEGIDLSFLGEDMQFISHFTMECGNDNLMGQGTTAPVPEPSTMLLIGTGLLGFANSRRKSLRQK